jgi:hypothetical protein
MIKMNRRARSIHALALENLEGFFKSSTVLPA